VTAFRSPCCDPAARTDERPMSLFRKAAKRDQSERLVIETLRQLGWSVLQVSVKDGPDLFAAKRCDIRFAVGPNTDAIVNGPRCVAIECKTGKRKLKPGQDAFRNNWQGEYVICRSVEDVLKLNQGA
jgi:hypothetical protein